MKAVSYSSIAAISSPPGKGGVAIIRVSGEDALEIVSRVFHPASKKSFAEAKPRMQTYGYIIDRGERVDDCLATYFPSPSSYTGEDVVEISCHGGVLVSAAVLETLFRAGAVPAEAGEFTRRAFINGKLSLTEAEGIGNLLEAESREQVRLAAKPSRDRLKEKISEIRRSLVELQSSIYARIDYPDEDLGDFTEEEILVRLGEVRRRMESLADTYKTGRAISEGIRCAIIGKPNVGKSSLYNAILGEDKAIVTSIAGTTRDVLEASIPLGRVMLRLADTAGIRDKKNADTVESIGIERSEQMLAKSELIFTIFDISREFDKEDDELLEKIKGSDATKIAILNKCDLLHVFDESRLSGYGFEEVLHLCAREDEGLLPELSALVDRLFTDEKVVIGEGAVISNARQMASLTRGIEMIKTAEKNLTCGYPQDLVSDDIALALEAIGELDGRAVSEEVVADIFSKFCVGK